MKRGMLYPVAVLCCLAIGPGFSAADEREPDGLDVPYEPTHPEVVDAMLGLAGVTGRDVVYDLGCGDGRIVVRAAKSFGARGVGIDLDPQRIREARENAGQENVGELVEFREADLLKTDIRPASVVTLYLLSSVNLALRPKLLAELRPGTRIVSHAFSMDDWEADRTLEHARARGQKVYFWVVPACAGGVWRWTGIGSESAPAALKLGQHFQRISGGVTLGQSEPVKIDQAALTGKQITFFVTLPQVANGTRILFQGTIEGDTISGTQKWQDGSNKKRPWTATREPVNLAGMWAISGGEEVVAGRLRIEPNEDKQLAAAFTRTGGEEQPLPAFYVWGAAVRFEVPRERGSLVYTGLVQGDTAEGTVTGGGLSGPQAWAARRAGAVSAAPAADGAPVSKSPRRWRPGLGRPSAGDEYLNPQDGSILIWIPGGEFTMGRDDGQEDERPAHRVKVGDFWLGKFEVTNRQYAQFADLMRSGTPMFWDNPDFNRPDQPVVGVTFSEAQSYCERAGLRLPTEAEWEYAAGGGRQLAFSTATGEIGPNLAQVRVGAGESRVKAPAAVGQFPPNPLGIHDLAGNAWEWTSSRFNPYPYSPTDGREDDMGGLRVLRGGCWAFPADYAATTRRHRFSAYLRYDYPGIRVARSPLDIESETAAQPARVPVEVQH